MCRGSVDDLSAYRTQIRIQHVLLVAMIWFDYRLSISYLFHRSPRCLATHRFIPCLTSYGHDLWQRPNPTAWACTEHSMASRITSPLITRCDNDHDWSHEITRWVLPVRGCNKIVWPRHAQVYPLSNFLRSWFMTASQPLRGLALSTAWLASRITSP